MDDTVHLVTDALRGVGLEVAEPGGTARDRGVDLLVGAPGGRPLALELKRRTLVRDGDVRALSTRSLLGPELHMVVADRITASARRLLTESGWSWLDLRGRLRVAGPGVLVDADIPPVVALQTRDVDPLSGQVAQSLALLALMHPTEPLSVRPASRVLDRAASSVSTALTRLKSAGLLDRSGRAAVPDLFEALSGRWRPVRIPVSRLPEPTARSSSVLELGMDGTGQGWAVTDTLAASAYGAPVVLGRTPAPDFYLPSRAALDGAVRLLGGPVARTERAATVALAPVAPVTSTRVLLHSWGSPWPLVHPVVVALDLAQDPGRGLEILESWTPGEPWSRVW